LFLLTKGGLLSPVELCPTARFDDDLVTIPKYSGKTNEQFTQLLLNVTLAACKTTTHPAPRRLTVLDPVCGRGTTLNQALMYGYDAIGIEHDAKDVDAYAAFLRSYLRRKRIKHQTSMHPVRRDRQVIARRFTVTVTPPASRAGDDGSGQQAARDHDPLRLTVFHADTVAAPHFLTARCADVLVADTPYGVAHRERRTGRSHGLVALLTAALPVWWRLLRPGGALGLAWNTYLVSRTQLAALLTNHGFVVMDTPGYRSLEHRVDQAIVRDVLVAGKMTADQRTPAIAPEREIA
jgi:SAM-dependent methyltransferase